MIYNAGIGPITAFKLIKEHRSIEAVLKHLESENLANSTKKKKFNVPREFIYEEARELFLNPKIDDGSKIEVNFIFFMCLFYYK